MSFSTTDAPTLLPQPISRARTLLQPDPNLLTWFDQWQIDHSIGRPTTDPQLEDLKTLTSATTLDRTKLDEVAKLITPLDPRVATALAPIASEKKP
jgi:hypothetical protein